MAADILEEIAARTRMRVAQAKEACSAEDMERKARTLADGERMARKLSGCVDLTGVSSFAFPFFHALMDSDDLSFIAEVKKASPSKGIIAQEYPYVTLAESYERGKASAISCLTEPFWFLGDNDHLKEITEATTLPVLRKDFVVDDYMIYEAKVLGASAVLLIVALLTDEELERYHQLAESLGLSVLVEAHDEEEIKRALAAGARIIGVNNRNLRDFSVDVKRAEALRSAVPDYVAFVAESGVQGAEDVACVSGLGADGVLIGEALMRAEDPAYTLQQFRVAAQKARATR